MGRASGGRGRLRTRRATRSPTARSSRSSAPGSASRGRRRRPSARAFARVNVLLRKELDLYACIRPCKAYEGVRTRFPETDIVIVRENTEDLYAGIEFEKDSDEAERLRDVHRGARRLEDPRALRHQRQADLASSAPSGSCAPPSTTRATNGRKKVTAAHKANIMKFSDGLFLEVAAQGRRGLRRHRVRGPHHRQPLQSARVAARGVRRDRAAQPLRRHRVRPRRRHDRRPRPGARRQHRHRGGDVRGHPRLGPEVQGAEQGEPDRAAAVGCADAAPPRARRRRPTAWRPRSPR